MDNVNFFDTLKSLAGESGLALILNSPLNLIMIAVSCLLLYLAIVKKFEPLLLMPIAFGMLLTNLMGSEIFHEELFAGGHANWSLFNNAIIVDSNHLAHLGEYIVNEAGYVIYNGADILREGTQIVTLANGDVIGHITTAFQTGAYLTDTGALVIGSGDSVTTLAEVTKVILSGEGNFIQAVSANANRACNLWGAVLAEGASVKTVSPGLLDYLYLGVKLGIYPCLIFVGVGAMTDFGPLIANPKSLLLGAAAQLGIFLTFFGAKLLGFTTAQSGAIGIIGGADGPTAIWLTGKLAPELLGPIAVAAYSYMALVPVIQPPIMRALTTKKEREIVMKQLRPVSKTEKILFPIVVTILVSALLPSATSLVGCLMLGNLMKESGVADRLVKTASNELMNIVTIFLGITVGATATAGTFLNIRTLEIIALGIVAFGFGTAGGVLLAKLMNKLSGGTINPLIGSAGVSAVPMAARVSNDEGKKANPGNFLLMHAMGPNVAGVIGSAIAAGVLLSMFG
ncbi:MAG: sodium ion-translocating decarboxylase subunit beta [Clostridia bacterium]|nr:sodium ion-translocating decarboxylase subunit beta [Clostridia bacterium]